MDKETRSAIERATQKARRILETDFAEQLEGTFEVLLSGVVTPRGGAHLSPRQHAERERIVASIEHRRAAGEKAAESIASYLRDAAFTALNRFAALEMIEARGLAQECVRKGEQSSGYREFTGLAPGVALLPGGDGYRLYLECLFDELSTEVKVLFDRRDPASVLWPRRAAFEELLGVLNGPELAAVWGEDETIGWVYQYFNSGDERRAMRDASQAPRNSRELAVRNQFFTPRYVVRFLTENTLARIWIEMMGDGDGASRIADRCDFLVRDAGSRGPRAKKDPRDLKLLDPACGSGHFLLYSFDLFLSIYEEAWADPAAAASTTTGRTLRADYPDLAALRRAAPALILEQNLHGVDIDPRCAQIAALALWLRAQRAWKDAGLAASQRPRITKTNIVVAEPMPGDARLVEEFAATLNPPLLGDLFRKMVAEMGLAGELGTLLKVETLLADEIQKACVKFNKLTRATGYLPGLEPPVVQSELDFSQIDDDTFFERAEELLLAALRGFAESAVGGAGVRKRLFAGDALQGIALVDLLRSRFDVILMNPPFGAASKNSQAALERFKYHARDLASDFVSRALALLSVNGHMGAITTRSIFFLKGFMDWRETLLQRTGGPVAFLDLGFGVLDAAVEASAFTTCAAGRSGPGTYLSALGRADRFEERDASELVQCTTYRVDASVFRSIPRQPFAYWISMEMLDALKRFPRIDEKFDVLSGGNPRDDSRFVRHWCEVSSQRANEWVSYSKGGEFARYYFDVHLMLKWRDGGHELKAQAADYRRQLGWSADWRALMMNYDRYLSPGLTWPRRTGGLSFRILPAGCVFGDKSPVILARGADLPSLVPLLGYLNAAPVAQMVGLMVSRSELAQSFEVGIVGSCAIPNVGHSIADSKLGRLARRAWSLRRDLDRECEAARAFVLPVVLEAGEGELGSRVQTSASLRRSRDEELTEIQHEIDQESVRLLGLRETGTASEVAGVGSGPSQSDDPEDGGSRPQLVKNDSATEALECLVDLLSWSIGIAFGRFDLRLATGERAIPPEPDPFDPLPVCSPGMLTGADGLPCGTPPSGYPIDFPQDGVLLDDPGHARDLTASARAVFDVVFGGDADARWQEAAGVLDPKNHDLRAFVARTFFEQHLKRYSKSRRKAPIYWQLATPSASYSIWLYAHRLTPDTFFHVLHDVVAPKLGLEERKLLSLTQEFGPNPTASQRKEIAAEESFVDELRAFRDEVTRVAPLWKPDLDDGVLLTMAPLWRLVPQHRAWQKELKTAWESLSAGEYDWAHVAMHLWPERVVPKCATDRSLAIAHGLEDVFWEEGAKGKWTTRETPQTPVADLVAERTSPAVKSALKDLLEAPQNRGANKGSRKGRTDA